MFEPTPTQTTGAVRAANGALALRLAGFYGAVFAMIGVLLPFWPVWLQSRGLAAGEIGVVLAAPFWLKVVSNPLLGRFADRAGERKRPMVLFAAGSLAVMSLFLVVEGFWALLIVNALAGILFAALMPLGEALTLGVAHARGLEYGRIRLWGSLTFIIAATAAGKWLGAGRPEIILWLVLGLVAATAASCLALPDGRPAREAAGQASLRAILARRSFLLMAAAASLIQASHAVYYGFATLHWRSLGFGHGVIGLLWAEGVIAEVVLFAFGGAVLARAGPAALLVIAGLGGVLRWTVTAWAADLGTLLAMQVLHALTFGAAHLAAMHFIARAVPATMAASAQALYSALAGGLVIGGAMMVSGGLYQSLGAGAFLAMSGLSAVGVLAALALWRSWSGGQILR